MEFNPVLIERQRIAENIIKSYTNVEQLPEKQSFEEFKKSLSVHDVCFTPKDLKGYIAKSIEKSTSPEEEKEFYQKAVDEISKLEKAIVTVNDILLTIFVKRVKEEEVIVK